MVEGSPPGDALPPPPQRATPARKGACCGASAGSPGPHRPHPAHTGRGTLAARSRGRAAGGGTAPDTRRPSQWWKAPPPWTPLRHPHSEQRRPAGAHAVGPVLGPHAHTDRTRDTRVAEPRPPAPEGGPLGEGQRLTPDAPHNGGRPTPPGTAPHQPRGTQPPQGLQAKGTVLGPHTHTPAPTARGWRTPTARPVGGQFREGERLTTDAPHNGGRHPPRGRPSTTPTASNAGPQGRTLWGQCWVPRLHRVHPGHTGRGTPAARPRGRAAGGGTAPDTGRLSQRWQATPPGNGPPPPPRHAAPTGHAGQGDSVGSPHPHTRAHSTWVADPNSPPSGRAVGGGRAPNLRRPSQWWKALPPGDALAPPPQQATPARRGARCGASSGSPRSHQPHPGHTGRGPPAARPRGRAAGGGAAPDTIRPSQQWQATPPGTAPHHPRGTQPPQGMQAKGTVLGPHTHTPAPTARGWRTPTARPVGGQSGQGDRLTSDAPHSGGGPPPGDALPPPPQQATPARKGARCETSAGSPRPHRPHPEDTGRGTPAARRRGRAVGEGAAPETRRPSQQWEDTPPRGWPLTTPAARSPRRACRPSQVGGNRDRTAPPQARQTEQETGAGHAEGHRPRGTALPAPSAGTARGAHATPPRGGGGADTAGVRAHTHAKGTRGLPEGQPDRARGTHRPRGMAYQRARVRDSPDGMARHKQRGTRGAGRGKRERHNTRYRPEPPKPAATAAHTRTGHCTRQGSSGALRHAPAPRLGSLRASQRGSHWQQASSTGPAAPAPRATTHWGGKAVGKRPQPRLPIDALTGDWRNGEAGEGRGSKLCEPRGLRHQAGGASWRAPH